jgi:hypothetical protein
MGVERTRRASIAVALGCALLLTSGCLGPGAAREPTGALVLELAAEPRGARESVLYLERVADPKPRAPGPRVSRAGAHRFYCSLHPEESFVLFASPSDHYVLPDGRRVHRIEALPAGAYRLSWWSDAGVRTAAHVEIRPGVTERRTLREGPGSP